MGSENFFFVSTLTLIGTQGKIHCFTEQNHKHIIDHPCARQGTSIFILLTLYYTGVTRMKVAVNRNHFSMFIKIINIYCGFILIIRSNSKQSKITCISMSDQKLTFSFYLKKTFKLENERKFIDLPNG